jgi:hypothetical protein
MASSVAHSQSISKASTLTGFQVMNAIAPLDVITVLNREKISFVLVGAYGLAGWTQKPRATEDVDVIVAGRQHKKAVRALLAAFPDLDADEQEVVTRFRHRNTRTVAIDVMKPNQLYRAAFKHTVRVKMGHQRYRIPSLEMALAMKFAPMISLTRQDPDKLQDAADFSRIVLANPDIDLKALSALAELVYSGGGREIVELVRRVRAGERLQL